tara:strand:- start:1934 stop:3733 length:1800 start_codon:yes stop_codon:yes gene_type:complete
MITRKYLEKIVMEEVKFVEEKFMSSKFRKAIEKYQDLQLKQQQLQKAFIGTKDIKQRDKLKKALIKMHYVVKKAEAEFNSALHIEPVEFDESVEKPRAQVNESTGLVAIIDLHDCEVEHPGIAHKAWDDQQIAESTKSYGDSLEKIARDKQLKMLTKKDKETLLKLADLMKKMKEGTINITKEQSGILKEKAQGLWANIRAKQDRGEAPAKKGSKAYDDAVAAGKKINNEADAPKSGLQSKGIDSASMQHLALDYMKATGILDKMPRKSYQNWMKTLKTSHTSKEAAASLMNLAKASGLISKIGKSAHKKWMKKMLGEGKLTEAVKLIKLTGKAAKDIQTVVAMADKMTQASHVRSKKHPEGYNVYIYQLLRALNPKKLPANKVVLIGTTHEQRVLKQYIKDLAKEINIDLKKGLSIPEGKLTEAKDRVLNKLFQRSRAVTSKSGEDKLYKLSQDWEDWNVDNDDKYDDLVDHLFAAVELVQDAGTPGVNNVTKDKEWYSYMKSADKHLKTFTKDVMKAMKLHKEGVVTEVDSHTHSNCSCTKQENTTPVNEDEGKVKCPKCNGEGCSHCNNTGFHVAEDKLFPRKPSEKKINTEGSRE